MLFILKNYLDIQLIYQSDNTPPDVVKFEDESTDTIVWSAQWLAYDISKLLTTDHLQFYTELISKDIEQEEKSELIYHFMKYFGNKEMDDITNHYESCRSIWSEFERIFTNELNERGNNES